MNHQSAARIVLFFCLACSCAGIQRADAFSYIFAGETNGLDIVTHPIGYTGTGGVINVSVGIDATSMDDGMSNTALMEVSVQNVIRTWNALVPTTGNVVSDFVNIPIGQFDFESVLLHEVGHSIGIGHNNLGVQTGVGGANTDFGASGNGIDNSFNFGAGVDGVVGTRDDVRGDDQNLNYFRTSGAAADQNNPFTIDAVVDSTTYSRDLADLPVGDLYAGVASLQNASTIASVANNTEAVMNQGTANNQIQRTLAHDDVAAIRYANSGLDSLAGTADDYTLVLTYAGITGAADILIDFDNSQTGFAVSQSGGNFITGDDVRITSNSIFFNDSFNWFYNQTANVSAVPEPTSLALFGCGILGLVRRRRNA